MCSQWQQGDLSNCHNHALFKKYTTPNFTCLTEKTCFKGRGKMTKLTRMTKLMRTKMKNNWEISDTVHMIKERCYYSIQILLQPLHYLICAVREVFELSEDNWLFFLRKLFRRNAEMQSKNENKLFYKNATKLVILSSYCKTGISPEI